MKQNIISKLALVVGLLLISQSGLAMKRPDTLSVGGAVKVTGEVITSIFLAFKVFLSNQLSAVENYNPYAEHEDFVFSSSAGEEFHVPAQYLNALMGLSPTIAHLVADAEGLDLPALPLNLVSSHAVYILTQMARGYRDFSEYLSLLTHAEIEKLKQDAQFLDSDALKGLLASVYSPFELHCNDDVLMEICERSGPIARTQLRSVSRHIKQLVDKARLPKEQGGHGWTDTLPVVATIDVGSQPLQPVALNSLLFVSSGAGRTVHVIDPTQNHQVIHTLVFGSPTALVGLGGLLYAANRDGTISVMDPDQNYAAIQKIRFPDDRPLGFVKLGRWKCGSLLLVMDCDGRISLKNQSQNQVTPIIQVGKLPRCPVLLGSFIYVANFKDGTVSVIDLGGWLKSMAK